MCYLSDVTGAIICMSEHDCNSRMIWSVVSQLLRSILGQEVWDEGSSQEM